MNQNNVSRETKSQWRRTDPLDLLVEAANLLKVELSQNQAEKICAFLGLVLEYNKKTNLIGPSTMNEAVILHAADSLASIPFFPSNSPNLLDIGSGAGFPGLVLKIIKPEMQLAIIESNQKKWAFQRHVCRILKLDGVEHINIHAGSVEAVGLKNRFSLVSTRAVGKLNEILPLCAPYLANQGRIIAYKGPRVHEELKNLSGILPHLNLGLIQKHEFDLPFIHHRRCILIFEPLGGKNRLQ